MTAPKIILLEGVSLMNVSTVENGRAFRIECPGCHRVEVYRDSGAATFPHADGCSVSAEIAAIKKAAVH